MTNEEKQAVLQFMGTVYGDAHKQDQMLIGQSGNLQPSSHVMKQRFEEVIRTPTEQQQYLAAQQQNAPAPAPVQEPAASAPPAAAPPAVTTNPDSSNQLEFDLSEPSKIDKLIDLIKEQNLLLKKISLKLDNGKGAKSTKKG